MTLLNHSPGDHPFRSLQEVRAKISALREALLQPSPDGLIESIPGLSQAAEFMAIIERQVRVQPAVSIDLVRELKSLKMELCSAAQLIQHGFELHRGWARLLGAAASGYTAAGEAAQLNPPRSLALEG